MPTANEQFQAAKVANNTSFSAEWARTQQALAKMSAGDRAAQLGYSSLQPGEYVMAYDALGQARMRIGHQTDGTVAVVYGNGKPPPVPTAPIVSSRQLAVFVYWDGKFTGGYARPGDLARVDVHIADDPAFIPDGTTIVGSLPQEGGLIVPADNETHYVKVVAVSTSDVASAATDGIAVLPLPAGQIAAGAIGAQQLAVDIALVSRMIVGDPSASRLELEGRVGAIPGMHLYDDVGQETFRLDATTGNVSIKGSIRSADTGERLVLREQLDSNDIRFYPATGNNYASLFARTFTTNGVDYGGVLARSPLFNNRSSYVWAAHDAAQLYRGDSTGTGVYSGLLVDDGSTDLSFGVSTTVNLSALNLTATYAQLHTYTSTGVRVGGFYADNNGPQMLLGTTQSLSIQSNGFFYSGTAGYAEFNLGSNKWAFQDNIGCWNRTLNAGLFFATTGFDIYNPTSGAPLAVGASAFVTKSARETKTAIEDVPFDPIEVIRGAPSSMWERHDDPRGVKQIGPMADDLPDVLQVETGPDGHRAIGIDLGSNLGVVWAAIPQLADRLDDLTARLDALEKKKK